MARIIRRDLVGTVHVVSGVDVLILEAGNVVPDGVVVGEHVLEPEDTAGPATPVQVSDDDSDGDGDGDGELFDPAQHSVDDVNAYLAEHPDEAEDIYQAELVGKARKGVLEGPAFKPGA